MAGGDQFPCRLLRQPAGHARHGHAIVCARCGVDDQILTRTSALPPDVVAKKFAAKGWRVDARGMRHLCAGCQTAARAKPLAHPLNPPDPVMPVATPSPAASRSIAELYMMLDDAYDRALKRYREGWSDARIAKDLGLAEAMVAQRREQDFGPLVVDTTARDIKAELDALDADVVDMHRRLAAARSAFETEAALQATFAKGLATRLARLRKLTQAAETPAT